MLTLGTRWRTGNYAPRLLYPQEGTHVLTEWEAGLAPEPAWTILLSLPAVYPDSYSHGVTEQNYGRTEACVGYQVD